MNGKTSLLLTITILLISSVAITKVATAPAVTVKVNPSLNTASPGQQFTIRIEVTNVTRLYGWQLALKWEPAVLEAMNLTEGPFLSQEGAWETWFVPWINNTSGELRAAGWLLGEEAEGTTGSGALVFITFTAEAVGGTPLNLMEYNATTGQGVHLLDYYGFEVPHSVEDGYFVHPLPKVHVDPPTIIDPDVAPGATFDIAINVSEVEDLYAWQLALKWEPAVLEAMNLTEGPFLSQEGAQETDFYEEIDQAAGSVYVNCTLVGEPVPTASGNGTLVTITFQVESYGSIILDLFETKLVDIEKAVIPHAHVDGYFSNALHDIAVTLVEASPTEVGIGDSVSISVTVENEGSVSEDDIDVAVSTPSPSYVPIGTQTISTLNSGEDTVLTFSWDTSDVAEGEYTIRAEATVVLDETDTADNVRDMDGVVTVTADGGEIPLSTLIIVGVIIAAVIGLSLFFYIRRKP